MLEKTECRPKLMLEIVGKTFSWDVMKKMSHPRLSKSVIIEGIVGRIDY